MQVEDNTTKVPKKVWVGTRYSSLLVVSLRATNNEMGRGTLLIERFSE
jgi:hypothetical protein